MKCDLTRANTRANTRAKTSNGSAVNGCGFPGRVAVAVAVAVAVIVANPMGYKYYLVTTPHECPDRRLDVVDGIG